MGKVIEQLKSLMSKIHIGITGTHESLLNRCPPWDLSTVHSLGRMMVASMTYQTTLFYFFGTTLLHTTGFNPEIFIGAFAIALFIQLIDSFGIMRSGWYLEGMKELARGGIDISGGARPRLKAICFLIIRIFGLAIVQAQLLAIIVSLLIFKPDIDRVTTAKYLSENGPLIAKITKLVDDTIDRETKEVSAEGARVATLSNEVAAVRQNVIDPVTSDPQIQEAEQELSSLIIAKQAADKALEDALAFATAEYGGIREFPSNSGREGKGVRYHAAMDSVANARARVQDLDRQLTGARARLSQLRDQTASKYGALTERSRERLPEFEKALKDEAAKLAALQEELAKDIANREIIIRKAVQSSPEYVGYDDGFLGQISTLDEIAHKNRKIAAIIILIEIGSFSLEMAAVLAKVFGFVPTTFSALLVSESYMAVVRIADELANELKKRDEDESVDSPPLLPPDPPSDGPGGGSGAPAAAEPPEAAEQSASPPEQPKRKRGRPRKHPILTVITGSKDQQIDSQQREDPPEPA